MAENNTHEKTILIADNSPLNRMQISGILEAEYDILEADDGRAALEIMREQGPDKLACVLLDLYMPGTTGFDVLEEKLADPVIADIPVIIITADSITAAEVQALDLGAADFLAKPIEPEIMRRRIRSVVSARELEEQRHRIRMLEEIAWHSDHDDLTGIYTRKAFLRKAQEMLIMHPRDNFLLVVWDFDKFKLLNELFGTGAGDKVLQIAAASLEKQIAGKGIYGRLSNDYFAFCVPEGAVDVEQVIACIIEDITKLFQEVNIGLTPVITAGVYPVEDHTAEVSTMLDRALMAQYTRKGSYEEHVAYYDTALSEQLLEEQDILNNMEAALERGEFRVQLQPVYDIVTGRPASAEALVRWHRPGYGIVSPGVFIPLFEQNGFITKMDRNIWEQVCQILADRRDRGLPEIPISVNLSRRSVYSSSLYDTIVELTERYGIKPSLFRVEITESSYIDDPERIINMVKRLQEHGFTILMDDFGSGYSSLNALKDIPVDILKADMEFMRDFESGGRISSIFTSIVRMARWLGIPVIAEGVETVEQFEFLRSIGCRYTQGFYFARPMDRDEFEMHIAKSSVHAPENERIFSREDVNEILGGNPLLDQIMGKIFDGYVVAEWNEGNPEMIRSSERLYEMFGVDSSMVSITSAQALEYVGEHDSQRLLEACEHAIDTGESVTLTLDFVDTSGAYFPLEATIVCISAIETDAILFVAFRKQSQD